MRTLGISVASLAGCTLGLLLPQPASPAPLLVGTAVLLVGWLLAARLTLAREAGLLLVVAMMGCLRVVLAPAVVAPLPPNLSGVPVSLVGEVVTVPVTTPRSARFTVQTWQIQRGGQLTPTSGLGSVQALALLSPTVQRVALGDVVQLDGRLEPLDASAAASGGLFRAGVEAQMQFPQVHYLQHAPPGLSTLSSTLRVNVDTGFQRVLPPAEAAFAAGILLGGSTGLPGDVRADLQASGLSHYTAVDGYKVVVVAGAIGSLIFATIGRARGTLLVLLTIAAYVFLSGSSPSAVRAGIMVGLTLVARRVGRPADPLILLALAAALMALAQPEVILETSFQLSLSASLGLVLLLPGFQDRLRGLPLAVAEPASLTLAASLGALPVELVVFQGVSLISPLAHMVATPLLAPAFFGSLLLAATLPLPFPLIPQALAWLVRIPTAAILVVAHVCALVPGSYLTTGNVPVCAAVVLAGALLIWGVAGLPETAPARLAISQRWSASRRRARGLVLTLATAFAGVVLLPMTHSDGLLHVAVLSSSGHVGAFLRGPDRTTVLVAGTGLDSGMVDQQVRQRLLVWEHGLGALVLLEDGGASATGRLTQQDAPSFVLPPTASGEIALGGGAVLDVSGHNVGGADAVVRFGDVWLELSGSPPLPESPDMLIGRVGPPGPDDVTLQPYLWVGDHLTAGQADDVVSLPADGAVDLTSDGVDIWPDEDDSSAPASS